MPRRKDLENFRTWPIKEQMEFSARYWAFTDFTLRDWSVDYEEEKNFIYVRYGREECPDTKKKHLQGFLQLKNSRKYSWFRKRYKNIDFSPAYSSIKKNLKYCSKDGDFEEHGKAVSQGERCDLDLLYDKMKTGCSSCELLECNPSTYIKFHKGIEKAKSLLDKKLRSARRLKLLDNIIVIKGKAGTGKTRMVLDKHGDENVYILESKAKKDKLWFDGYDGEKVLLIDEFNGWIDYAKLLRILDVYKLRIPVKGGHTWAFWEYVYFTTNTNGGNWYYRISENLKRRIRKIFEVKKGTGHEVADSNMPSAFVPNSFSDIAPGSLQHSEALRVEEISATKFWRSDRAGEYGGELSDDEEGL